MNATLLPTLSEDGRLPQTIEELLPWREQLGLALARAMSMKAAADEAIAEFFGEDVEKVVSGQVWQFDGPKSWEYAELPLLQLLTSMQAEGRLTQADYEDAVELVPQPDRVKFNPTKLRALVNKRGLTEIDDCRTHKVGTKRLRRVGP